MKQLLAVCAKPCSLTSGTCVLPRAFGGTAEQRSARNASYPDCRIIYPILQRSMRIGVSATGNNRERQQRGPQENTFAPPSQCARRGSNDLAITVPCLPRRSRSRFNARHSQTSSPAKG